MHARLSGARQASTRPWRGPSVAVRCVDPAVTFPVGVRDSASRTVAVSSKFSDGQRGAFCRMSATDAEVSGS